ncbi:MAG: hypothetical protein KDB65_03880 [Calditrichaeota bacterium]|nr:hypothetical protein [Calditrichota bacterium]MCB9368801.1 hypothetical protein [Calditrichota bacterium]
MSHQNIPLRVGEIVTAKVRRKLSSTRVMIDLKGRVLVADPEQPVSVGDPITVQVLAISPRIRLRLLPPPQGSTNQPFPLDLRT